MNMSLTNRNSSTYPWNHHLVDKSASTISTVYVPLPR